MPIYDISVPIGSTTPIFPGDPAVEITEWMRMADGAPANVSLIKFGAHTGTHVDAPAHFIEGGPRAESLPLDVLVGKATVWEVPESCKAIDRSIAEKACKSSAKRILFKTTSSQFWGDSNRAFRSDYTYLDSSAAETLIQQGVELVGIDYLSVEQFGSEKFQTHHLLLEKGIVILEGLDLRRIPPGNYELICLPLKIRDGSGDGAPARAVLRTIE